MNKKFMQTFLAVSIMLFAAVFSPQALALSRDKAKEYVYSFIEQEFNYIKEELRPYSSVETETGGYAMSFKLVKEDPATDGLVVVEISKTGELVFIRGPKQLSLYEQAFYDSKKMTITVENVYNYKEKWAEKVACLSEEEKQEFERNKRSNPIYDFVMHDIRLPKETDISYEQAVACAEEAILNLPDWNKDKLDLMRICSSVYHVPVDSERAVYEFVYLSAENAAMSIKVWQEVDTGFNEKAFEKEAKKVFGINPVNNTPHMPNDVVVRIDAQTGEVVGKPYIEYPPVFSGTFMVFVLWENSRFEQ